jgi:hypothetical protein
MTKKVNYLNNKDILKEIHKSKLSYCSFSNQNCTSYDIIVYSLEEITPTVIEEAKVLRQERLAKEAQEIELAAGNKRKLDEFLIPIEQIPITDIVFRVMTWDHIPIDEIKQKKSDAQAQEKYEKEMAVTSYDEDLDEYIEPAQIKGELKYIKINFPPFQHYQLQMLDEAELTFNISKDLPHYKLVCVGKSHWKGNLDTGEFSKTHGQMTNKLAHMFIKLCERYATRSNWRGYTYNDEMRSQALLQLSQIGLQFNEAKSQNPFAYYTAAITNSFTRVLNTEKQNQRIRDDILEMNNFNPSYTRQNEWGNDNWGGDD